MIADGVMSHNSIGDQSTAVYLNKQYTTIYYSWYMACNDYEQQLQHETEYATYKRKLSSV